MRVLPYLNLSEIHPTPATYELHLSGFVRSLFVCYYYEMKNVILLHGMSVGPNDKWYPWLAGEMRKRGIKCAVPALPSPNEPVLDEWLSVIDILHPDEDTIFVGHSRGGVAVLRWLENQHADYKCKAVILIAANSGLNAHRTIKGETNFGFYTDAGYNFDEIKKHCKRFVVLHSKDDQWVPYAQGAENAQGLSAKLVTFEDMGHFGTGVDDIKEIVEIIEEL
jgi:predicted alpha/beta hydrolase family esterase